MILLWVWCALLYATFADTDLAIVSLLNFRDVQYMENDKRLVMLVPAYYPKIISKTQNDFVEVLSTTTVNICESITNDNGVLSIVKISQDIEFQGVKIGELNGQANMSSDCDDEVQSPTTFASKISEVCIGEYSGICDIVREVYIDDEGNGKEKFSIKLK